MTTFLQVAKIRYAWDTVYMGLRGCRKVSSQSQSQSHRSRKSSKSGDRISEEIIEDIDISGDDDFLASSQDKVCLGHCLYGAEGM